MDQGFLQRADTVDFSGTEMQGGTCTPAFPNFKPLEMSDRPAIESFTELFEPYSDFRFSTLFFYNLHNHTHWCWLNGNLILRLRDNFGPGTYLTFLGVQKPADTATAVIDYAAQMNYSPTLCRVPEVTAQAIKRETDRFKIDEDRNGFDYAYRVGPLIRLEGHAFEAVREKINYIQNRHPMHQVTQLDLSGPTGLEQIRSILITWQHQKHRSETIEAYCSALETCLCHASVFDLVALGLFADKSLVGFIICEQISGAWLMGHFVMSDPHCKRATTFLIHQMAHHASGLDIQYFNFQEDMGDPGLRRYKVAWAPSGFLRKFRISQSKERTRE